MSPAPSLPPPQPPNPCVRAPLTSVLHALLWAIAAVFYPGNGGSFYNSLFSLVAVLRQW